MTTIQNEVPATDEAFETSATDTGTDRQRAATGNSEKISPRTAVVGTAHKSSKFSGKQVAPSKTDIVLKRLRSAKGATVEEIMGVTGWQAHSVRGFFSGMVRKKLNLKLDTDVGKDGARRYRISKSAAAC